MKILVIGSNLDTTQLRKVFQEEACELVFFTSQAWAGLEQGKVIVADAALVGRDYTDYNAIENLERLADIPFVAALGVENIASGFTNLSPQDNEFCNQYILYGGEKNLRNLVGLIRHKVFQGPAPVLPEVIPFECIYGLDGRIYSELEQYLEEEEGGYDVYAGILSHRSRWLSQDLDMEFSIKKALNQRGIGVVLAFTMGSSDETLGSLNMEEAVRRFFVRDGRPFIEVLLNFVAYGKTGGAGNSLFERAACFYRELDLPVIRPIQSSKLTNNQWEVSDAPLTQETASCFDMAEMQGIIEPIYLGGKKDNQEHWVIEERVQKLARRVEGWIRLRRKSNAHKRLAVFLNSAVCSGVEATLGRASGLNSFESAVRLLRKLAERGYDVGEEIPQDGDTLRRMFLERKAYSDFRWTSVEDIVASGGLLYAMPAKEYFRFYDQMPEQAKRKMEKNWGMPPGEAMVLKDSIVITGIRFGNILLMIQPKRGCYGAKCTGEVCKILQDPACPPTHQYMASYFYGAEVFEADAWVHIGTHGSLEFLPGKASGISGACFSDIAVGNTPNFYIFNANCTSGAMHAKRRSYAVIVDHLSGKDGLHVLEEEEMNELLHGLEGGFVLPGGGGEQEDKPVVTGRNLYGVELVRIPTKEAYERGYQAAEAMAKRYLDEEGRYPKQVVVNMISMDIPRTKGEQFSLVLSLMGVRPVWNERGVVTGVDLISLEELKRPRIDVAVHISSVLRDTWPDMIRRLDEAILLATAEIDYVPRIFGNAPGTYSNSIGLALKASAWQKEKDLARYFIDSSSYVYGKEKNGEKNVEAFLDSVKRTEVTCDIVSMKQTGGMSSSYSSNIQGGYALAAKSLGIKRKVRSFMGESSGEGVAVKTLQEHVNDGLTRTLLNEAWKNRRMEEGYDGAAEIMHQMQSIFEMQCVNESFSDETLDALARQYVADEKMRRFMEQHNPYAGEETARRMLELNSRGKWKPADEVFNQLRKNYLKLEANLEDGLNGLGEIQGGNVDIIADQAVETWKERMQAVDEAIVRYKDQG